MPIQNLPPPSLSSSSTMTSSSFALHILQSYTHLPPPILFCGLQNLQQPNLTPFHIRKTFYSHSLKSKSSVSATSSSSSSSWEREEVRWLREEERWLREEQRWLREESRWNSERESLLEEIASLRSKIQSLERPKSESVIAELSSPPKRNQITEIGSGPVPLLLESEKEEEVKKVIVNEVRVEEKKEIAVKKKLTLKKGAEGDDVREMQEALQKLGFYSGEEDMEFSSFSSGTERAVKTWQASLGVREDGIMTEKLLEKLFTEQGNEVSNGAAVASAFEVSKIEKTVIKENEESEFDFSHNRVFLLGENRWEEPSRLTNRNKQVNGSKAEIDLAKCITCRGEGRTLCMECDGTGELNIEEQFMEWVDEGAKCPYCEGLGYNICDACDGKRLIKI